MNTAEFFKNLDSQNLTHLEEKAGVSRQALHSALKTHNMKLENLAAVAKALDLKLEFTPVLTEKNLLASLARWGAPVAHTTGGNLSLETTVAECVLKSRKDGFYEGLVSYVLAKNAENLDVLKLAAVALSSNHVNVFGYYTEMANEFRQNTKLQELLRVLVLMKNPESEFLVTNTKTQFLELFMKNTAALKWHVLVRGTLDDHLQRWKKWERSQKHN
jgi:hypothetical protein